MKVEQQAKFNNFDLVRLLAAIQVMVSHAMDFMGTYGGVDHAIQKFIYHFPGVPIFFFTSGFLISASYERSPTLFRYALNRFLRIYPALWASVVFSVISVYILYGHADIIRLLVWGLMQGTILQDWNPDFLRGYGIGVVNGSLWTIPVELSFYVITPILYRLFHKRLDFALICIASFSFFTFLVATSLTPTIFTKAFLLTPIPWVGIFLVGALAQRHFDKIRYFVEGKFFYWFAMYVVLSYIPTGSWSLFLFRTAHYDFGILVLFTLFGVVLSLAYSRRGLAQFLLRGNDISYGIYIFHMPIVNGLIHMGIRHYPIAIALTLVCASFSWLFIERPALKAKSFAGSASPAKQPPNTPVRQD